ncbi:MAG TPA: hypothetical protein VIE40_06190, partial [Dehalococcoidia bacterium]
MPLFGTLDIAPAIDDAPRLATLPPEPWDTPGAQILQVMYEIAEGRVLDLLPPALHPTIPPV